MANSTCASAKPALGNGVIPFLRPLSLVALALLLCAGVHAQNTVSVRGHVLSHWCYLLQGRNGTPLNPDTVTGADAQLAVMDYSADGAVDGEFTSSQIAAVKASGKVALAYMSIGEAESYRFYWDNTWTTKSGKLTANAPAWLAKQDPDWHGNFKVRYWMPEWQQIIFGNDTDTAAKSYVDRIIDAGFDGVYLDIIDAFEYFGPDSGKNPERPTAAADMASFVEAIANYARTTRGKSNFIVVPQNGSNIVDEISSSEKSDYFTAIDAIGAEDTFFYGPKGMNNAWHPQKYTIQCLTQFSDASKPVLCIEYVNQKAKENRFYNTAAQYGWLPLVSVRALDRLISQPQ
ncbi:MAG: endo alpha-1,4 polygalactosaminidase [Chthoniobacteraceae bacterium]